MKLSFGGSVSGMLRKAIFRGAKSRPELANRITRLGGADCTFVTRRGRSVEAELLIGQKPNDNEVDNRPAVRVLVALKAPRLKRREHTSVQQGRIRTVATATN